MVFAFGSPEGLRNTVTMGVVSAVARQPDPDSPLVYVQTDTPINPGNSGGALVDADGELVGINTFILSSSGGNQGLGFAIPAGVVASAYPQLLKFGHVHQPTIGALVQTITPEMAAALHLQRDFGVIVSDIVPGGPADTAGLKIQDIILGVDGSGIGSLPQFAQSLYLHKTGEHAKTANLPRHRSPATRSCAGRTPAQRRQPRGSGRPREKPDPPAGYSGRRTDSGTCASLYPICASPPASSSSPEPSGSRTGEIPLQTGDVIHGLNGAPDHHPRRPAQGPGRQ